MLQKISSNDGVPAHAAENLTGDKLLPRMRGGAACSNAGLQLHLGAGDAGWGPSLLSPHLPIPACFQTWLNVLEGGRAAGMTGRWHPRTLPTGDDRHMRGVTVFLG